jgi:5-formyltetrahydrofolate cyclo-ligase
MRKRRGELSSPQQAAAGRQMAQHLSRLPVYRRSVHVALYWAQGGEIELTSLLAICQRGGKAVYFPVIRDRGQLEFRRYRPGEPLRQNRFGIPEPTRSAEVLNALQLDLIVTPLVAYSRDGGRLGMGGGYYDRALHRAQKRRGKPLLLGAAHSFQEISTIPQDHWDVRLHGVVTERGYTPCSA